MPCLSPNILADRKDVTRVIHPAYHTGIGAERTAKYLPHGQGGLVGFELAGGAEAGRKFINALKLFYHVANIGDARSLAIHPASTTHSQLTESEQAATGVTPGYVRLSVGLEHIDDILADLDASVGRRESLRHARVMACIAGEIAGPRHERASDARCTYQRRRKRHWRRDRGAPVAGRLAGGCCGSRVTGAAPPGGRYVACDVADEAAVASLLYSVGATEQRLDALICNAGFMIRKPIADLSLAEWSSVLTTNLTSTFLLVRAAETLLRAAKGAVVTIASSRARMSEPDTESYSASKGGLGRADACAGDQPGAGCPGELHQSRLDFDQGAGAERGGKRVPPGRARRPCGGHRRTQWPSWSGRTAASSLAPSSSWTAGLHGR